MENVLPNGPFDIGATFSSYEDVQAAIHQYEEENYVQFWVNSSRTIAAAKKKGLTRDVDPALKYAEIEYSCTNGGRKFTSKSTGERPNQKTSKIGCKARIKFITSQDGHALQVKAIETVHNHIVSKLTFCSFCSVVEMFAVVRFLNDIDEKRHVIPVADIKDFKPANDSDFDKRATYSAFWRDPVDDEDTGFYNAQILMLAAMVKHSGLKTGEDVNKTVDSINRLLTEKIQDVLKSKRRTEGQ
ncbi:hypothetical protein MTO96_049758 [Rhipicephalus appendiculatus]